MNPSGEWALGGHLMGHNRWKLLVDFNLQFDALCFCIGHLCSLFIYLDESEVF
jgi:hypothetical protein